MSTEAPDDADKSATIGAILGAPLHSSVQVLDDPSPTRAQEPTDPMFEPMLLTRYEPEPVEPVEPVEPAEAVAVTRPGSIDRLALEASVHVEPAPTFLAEPEPALEPEPTFLWMFEPMLLTRYEPEEPEPTFLCTDAARRLAGLVGK